MDGFRYAYSLNGHKSPMMKELYIPSATAVEKGEPVSFTQGTGVIVLAEPTDLDDPIIGVAAEPHDASTSGRQSGNWIKVIVDPDAVYKYTCDKVYTLTGGSTTTAVDSSLVPQTDNIWIGGAIKIVTCAADSSLIGRIVKISDSTGSTGTLTLAETLPAALASGDTIRICPGYMMFGHSGYDLDSDAMNVNFDADGGASLVIVDADPDAFCMFVKFKLHALGNHVAAL